MRVHESRWGRDGRPAWWSLYVIAALLVGLFGLVDVYVEAGLLRRILEIVTLVAGGGAIQLWLRRNRMALDLARGRRHG
jgi:hypothetical protein